MKDFPKVWFCGENYAVKLKSKPLEERFWSRVDKSSKCWNWTGTTPKQIKNSYGVFKIYSKNSSKYVSSHRVSWQLKFGKIPKGLLVCHRCNNKRCVNPKHLYLGTPKQNIKDAIKDKLFDPKNNWLSKRKYCKHGHKYTNLNTKMIGSRRQCLTCKKRICRDWARNKYSYIKSL